MTKTNLDSIPYLDPSVQHVGISKLRALNVTQLRDMDKTLVIQDNDKPLAVLLKYEHFMAIQERLRRLMIEPYDTVRIAGEEGEWEVAGGFPADFAPNFDEPFYRVQRKGDHSTAINIPATRVLLIAKHPAAGAFRQL
jgi:hypothetical protein